MSRGGVLPRAFPVRPPRARPSWAGKALLGVTGALVAFGLLSVYSASSFVAQAEGLSENHYLLAQLGRAGAGGLALLVAAHLNHDLWRRLAWPLVTVTALGLLLLVVPGTEAIAPRVNGARRWLRLGVSVQPSELAKLTVIAWTAALAVRKQDRLHSFRYGLVPFLVVLGPLVLLVLLQPHFSAALMLAVTAGAVLFAAGARLSHFALLGVTSLPILWDQIANTGYRLNRVAAFLDPAAGAPEAGYQLHQSLIAIGSGGLFGVGFGRSSQKLAYLPEPQNDFIFSIIAEEWGLVGSMTVIGLFLAWALLGMKIAAAAPDLFGRLLATGITTLIVLSAFGHIGVALGALPTTGVNLPFVSAGGTNLVLVLGLTGILLSVSRARRC